MDKFTRGLKPDVRLQVELTGCATLEKMIATAERVDTLLYASKRDSPPRKQQQSRRVEHRSANQRHFYPRMPDRFRKDQSTRHDGQLKGNQTKNPVPSSTTRMTPEERQKLKEKGLCYVCKQPGHPWYSCPNQKPKGINALVGHNGGPTSMRNSGQNAINLQGNRDPQ
jgi:hypothetical protein